MTKRNGLPCKQCGSSDWYDSGNCISCSKKRTKEWATNNKDKVAKQRERWARKNPEKHRANLDEWKKHGNKWHKLNPKLNVRNVTEWRSKNKGKVKAQANKRRARKALAGGSFTDAQWKQLCEKYGNRCLGCGKKLKQQKLTADHILPVLMGGSSNIENIQPLCRSCNSSKGANNIDYRSNWESVNSWVQDKLL